MKLDARFIFFKTLSYLFLIIADISLLIFLFLLVSDLKFIFLLPLAFFLFLISYAISFYEILGRNKKDLLTEYKRIIVSENEINIILLKASASPLLGFFLYFLLKTDFMLVFSLNWIFVAFFQTLALFLRIFWLKKQIEKKLKINKQSENQHLSLE